MDSHLLINYYVKSIIPCLLFFASSGIRPIWEDSQNTHGGRWLITLDKKLGFRNTLSGMTDSLWLETMLCLIGEAFGLEEYGDAGKLLYYMLTFRHLFDNHRKVFYFHQQISLPFSQWCCC